MSTIRSATRARTSSSWKIARKPVPRRFALFDQGDHRLAIGGVERSGRLVEHQQTMLAGEAAGDVDALLLAAREGRRRQTPQRGGQAQPRQQRDGALARGRVIEPSFLRSGGDDVERRNARDDAQELADIADDAPPRVEDVAWAGLGDRRSCARRRRAGCGLRR